MSLSLSWSWSAYNNLSYHHLLFFGLLDDGAEGVEAKLIVLVRLFLSLNGFNHYFNSSWRWGGIDIKRLYKWDECDLKWKHHTDSGAHYAAAWRQERKRSDKFGWHTQIWWSYDKFSSMSQYIFMYTDIHVCLCVYVYIDICMFKIYVYIYIYIYSLNIVVLNYIILHHIMYERSQIFSPRKLWPCSLPLVLTLPLRTS